MVGYTPNSIKLSANVYPLMPLAFTEFGDTFDEQVKYIDLIRVVSLVKVSIGRHMQIFRYAAARIARCHRLTSDGKCNVIGTVR